MRAHLREIVLALILLAAIFGWITHEARTWGLLPKNRVRHLRLRLRLRRRPGRGFASGFSLWLRWGRMASFRESRRVRPSLPAWVRLLYPRTHSQYLGRAHWWRTLRISLQEHLAIVGPPRAFKSAVLSRLIMNAPGSVVSTSSKPDMFTLTSGLREARGSAVHVFNPQGIGGIPSTLRWSPVEGCRDAATAIRRADAFTEAADSRGTDDGAFWDSAASNCMRALFTAAALVDADMRLVARWATGEHTQDALDILLQAGRPELAGALRILTGEAQKTAETIRVVLARALSYMTDPQLAASTLPADGDAFDIDTFLTEGGTLYMIAKGNGKDAALGPLFAALANEIQFRATQIGSRMAGGRMDPPLLMALDEVTQICPVPLPSWLADSGGQGVQIVSAFHGVAQLQERWGHQGAQTVLDTSNVRVFLGGLGDTDTLQRASTLCGQAAWREQGQDHYSRSEVLTPDMLRELPPGFALLVRGANAPVIAKLARGWRDRGYRRLRRAGAAVAALTPAAPPRALDAVASGLLYGIPDRPVSRPVAPAARLRSVASWPAYAEEEPGAPEVAEVLPPEPAPAYPWRPR